MPLLWTTLGGRRPARARAARSALALFIAAAAWLAQPAAGHAQGREISFIRDAEIENTIRVWATPIFAAAGLPPEDIRIHLVNDTRLNAFVAGGMNLFINTGLLQRSAHAGQVIGVIAHETGHIAGGHLVRIRDELEKATIQQVVAMVLGAGAAIGGAGSGGMGAAAAGADAAQRSLLAYTRVQESAADQAGMRFMDRTGISSKGIYEFLNVLVDQEILVGPQDPYLRSHPITRERVEVVRAHLENSPLKNAPLPAGYDIAHARMVAKLTGFLYPPGTTMTQYPAGNTSLPARYARAIALYRKPDMAHALPLMDGLIAELPNDPYFWELKGQSLFENGRPTEAAVAYREAVRLYPESPLLREQLGRVLIELGQPEQIKEAIAMLAVASRAEPDNAGIWRNLGIAYGKDGQIGMASLALAESALNSGQRREAQMQAARAQKALPEGSAAWLRADDLKRTARRKDE